MRDSLSHDANLDVVRATAVILVATFHLTQALRTPLDLYELARLGVAFFFVHSGIVNMLSLERQARRFGPRALFRVFIAKRCLRIYPLSIVVVCCVYFTGVLPTLPHNPSWTAAAGVHPRLMFILSLLLLQNFTRLDEILPPLWSLPFEMQLYLLFPSIFRALRRLSSAKAPLLAWIALAAAESALRPVLAR